MRNRVRQILLGTLAVALLVACTNEDKSRSTMTVSRGYTDAGVTPELYRRWRSPRFGQSNPEIMNNPVWDHFIRSRANAYRVNQDLSGPSPFDAGPAWCFDRFGQSTTLLEDGRKILIAGEHEDSYDPDFFIYNDVVVIKPDNSIDIYGYPKTAFPPTDFHSATLVNDRIVLVGNLGYSVIAEPERTQLLVLRLEDFSISQIQSVGTSPGWIHKHTAVLSDDGKSIVICGGKLERGGDRPLVENIDDWRLWLDEWRWERLTDRQWPRWVLRRHDGEMNHLSDMRNAIRFKELGLEEQLDESIKAVLSEAILDDPEFIEEITKKSEIQPNPELHAKLYRPKVPHTQLPEREDEYGVYRISIDGVTVRYIEDSYSVQVTVEGKLSSETIEMLKRDLLEKLRRLEKTPWVLETI